MRAAEACGTPILNGNASSQAQSRLTQRWLINRNHQTKDFSNAYRVTSSNSASNIHKL
jgi:hypothetical protein